MAPGRAWHRAQWHSDRLPGSSKSGRWQPSWGGILWWKVKATSSTSTSTSTSSSASSTSTSSESSSTTSTTSSSSSKKLGSYDIACYNETSTWCAGISRLKPLSHYEHSDAIRNLLSFGPKSYKMQGTSISHFWERNILFSLQVT